jgi:acetoacetate decarboxylase
MCGFFFERYQYHKDQIKGADSMQKNKRDPNYKIKIIRAENGSGEIIRGIVKEVIETVLAKNGVVSDNLDEVLLKYIKN